MEFVELSRPEAELIVAAKHGMIILNAYDAATVKGMQDRSVKTLFHVVHSSSQSKFFNLVSTRAGYRIAKLNLRRLEKYEP